MFITLKEKKYRNYSRKREISDCEESLMKTILSIDFDIVMAPSIEIYNAIVPKYNWEEIAVHEPFAALAYPDYEHYQKLVNFIINLLPHLNKNQIVVIENHGKIVNHVPVNEDYRIINIDHHHDVWYPPDPKCRDNDSVNCANWVRKLYETGYLKESVWVKNLNSADVDYMYSHIINKTYNFSEWIEKNENFIPDQLVLSLSEPWVPTRIRPLFYLILDILNKYYNTHFNIEYEDD